MGPGGSTTPRTMGKPWSTGPPAPRMAQIGERGWVDLAWELLAAVLDRFGDGAGGFYDTADDGEALVYRPADPADGPTPSGAFAAAGALLSYAADRKGTRLKS